MSWVESLAGFTKRLIIIDIRITNNEERISANSNEISNLRQLEAKTNVNEKLISTNAEEINNLRQDLRTLTNFVRRVAYAVKLNEERAENKHDKLILALKYELSKLEKNLLVSKLEKQLSESED